MEIKNKNKGSDLKDLREVLIAKGVITEKELKDKAKARKQ